MHKSRLTNEKFSKYSVETTYNPNIQMDDGNYVIEDKVKRLECRVDYPVFMEIKYFWTTPHDNIAFTV